MWRRAALGTLLLVPTVIASAVEPAAVHQKPNILVILVDDMGYGDIAAHGNPVIRTPQLDRLCADSVRLTDFHVDPTCAPTRSALMTGKYSHRVKVWHTIAAGNHLRAGELTMADVCRANGYRTGMFGKWHLGSNFPYRPIDRGFDEWLGQGDGGTGTTDDYFFNDRVNDHYLHNGQWKQIDGWAPDVFFNAAVEFIRGRKQDNRPFFLYLCTYLPHDPHTLPNVSWADDLQKQVDARTAFFLAAIEKIDARIGDLRAALAEEGLDRDTLLIFMTDNGGTAGVNVFNAHMRGKKGDVYDGGHRVPFFIHWPAGGLQHGEDVTSLNAHIDVLPTLVDLCGLKLPREVDFDGRSFGGQLLDAQTEPPERTLFVERQRTYQAEKWRGATGMTSRWRLVNDTELYDIQQDPGQQQNVVADHPDVVARIRADFETYWAEVTPGDRDRTEFIVGDDRDPETFLHPADWHLPNPPWNHASIAAGPSEAGDWRIRAAHSGRYRFEVRRWPREADAPLDGVPEIRKTVDAWDARGPKPDLIYGNTQTKFRTLPVAAVRLTVGDETRTVPASAGAKQVTFDVELETERSYAVKAELLDGSGQVLAGGYYVYCQRSSLALGPQGQPRGRRRTG
jgi:arylsulfatase A-like enzyme